MLTRLAIIMILIIILAATVFIPNPGFFHICFCVLVKITLLILVPNLSLLVVLPPREELEDVAQSVFDLMGKPEEDGGADEIMLAQRVGQLFQVSSSISKNIWVGHYNAISTNIEEHFFFFFF